MDLPCLLHFYVAGQLQSQVLKEAVHTDVVPFASLQPYADQSHESIQIVLQLLGLSPFGSSQSTSVLFKICREGFVNSAIE